MSEYDKEPLSRVEEILDETSSGTEYDKEPLSRVEFRLKEVMAKIDGLVPDATVYKPAGSVTFANLPTPSKSTLGYVYDVSDAFTTTSDFKEGSGKKYPAGTNVAIVDVGTDENPIYKYDALSGFIDMDNYVEKETGKGLSSNDFTDAAKNKLDGLENYDDTEIRNDISELEAGKVDKVDGKGLSTNDYTDTDKALAQNSPITTTSTTSPLSTANGKPRAITIYGKSEVIDGVIKSAGEGYAVVRLADLTWQWSGASANSRFYATLPKSGWADNEETRIAWICNKYASVFYSDVFYHKSDKIIALNRTGASVQLYDSSYDNLTDFEASLGDTVICYQLADPTQGNAIAVKTDNGTGIAGTMATFTTGTPLRGIPETSVRDVMEWDGNAGTMTKVCGEVDLGSLTWSLYLADRNTFFAPVSGIKYPETYNERITGLLSENYALSTNTAINWMDDKSILRYAGSIYIRDTSYSDPATFKTAMGGVKLVYELATPTTQTLTSTENASLASLRTFTPQTHAQNNAGADMKIEAYANTANGQAVSDMQPTRSPLLTLTASGWTNNAQTVTFVHDTGRRNSIDVEPTSIKAWTVAGILATAETATSITFECDTVPTSDLSFRVTSMEVR